MALVLILGASRGIGRALVEAYVGQGHRVIATVRKAEDKATVQALGAEVLLVDVANPASVSGLAWTLECEEIDLAVYVAGVWDAGSAATPPQQPQFDHVMHTNVLGAMQVIPQVAPLVSEARGVFAFLSSEMSLISDAQASNWLYRTSKAALNMAVACAAQQWPDARLVLLDPGWVQTDMGGSGAPLTLADCVANVQETLASITEADRGKMVRHDGLRLQRW